ncbi:metal ABC transporter solute-binding protein, Zn/Mn family [Desulfatitalea alkaliphila]|uniref:Zinc ABC transporter substrate-binding protein n=1 Tax=Desulfatitalea alkaliphila TaxID=2929485 RepID=A0AA41R5L4_9BACT|nr:zinc ABC transporter substrate-binding protein [Desulfatitalea alkaliphila]MCJ8501490.1 zinc ABC transporter substrate-binding protein [Desulfatitalea alkaliphila]
MGVKRISLILVFLLCLAVGNAVADDSLTVFVSILPQQYFVHQIAGDLVQVQVMVSPGAGPHTYEPKPAQMAALAGARLYFSVGVAFEQAWLPRFKSVNPNMRVVAMDQGIEKMAMDAHAHHHHDDHPHPHAQVHAHAHAHDDAAALDPHIWLAPPLVKIMAGHTLAALQEELPEHAAVFQANHEAFVDRLDRLHRRIAEMLTDHQGMRFMVFHPSWGYFAHTYGLLQVPIEVEGKAPKPAQLQQLILEARAADIKVIFVQPQFSTRSARMIAEAIEGDVVAADPLAYEWEAGLLEQATALQRALR